MLDINSAFGVPSNTQTIHPAGLDVASAFGITPANNIVPGADTPNPGNISNAQPPQPTVNPDGTISTLTTGQPLDKQGAAGKIGQQAEELAGQTAAGFAEPILGATKVATDAISDPLKATFTDVINMAGVKIPQNIVDGAVKSLHSYITSYNKKHPDQLLHPSTLGNLLVYSLIPATAESTAGQAAVGGALSFINAVGSNKNYSDATKDAIIGAVITGGVSKSLNVLFSHMGPLSKQAKLLLKLNQNRLSETEALQQLQNIPRKDQVISLANSIHLAKNYFGAAVGADSRLATKLGARLEAHQSLLKPFVADAKEVANVKQAYSNMADEINTKYPNKLNATHIQQQLNDKMLEPYATDPSALATNLKKIKRDISEPISTGQALEIYKNINSIIKKPSIISDRKVSIALGKIKGQLLDFINTTIKNPDDMSMINQAIHNYKETMNRQQLGEIIAKNTNSKYATDYGKVLADVKKEHLIGKNTDFVIPILKEMTKRFGNDKYLGNIIDPKGQPHTLSALGARSVIIDKLYDIISPVVNRSRYKDIRLRKAIIKSIKREDTQSPLSFIDDLVKNKTITLPQVSKLKQEVPEAFAQLEYKGPGTILPKGEKLYSTTKGTTGTVSQVSSLPLHDAQKEIVTNALKDAGYSKETMNKVNNIVISGNKRIENIIKSIKGQTKHTDIVDNTKRMKAAIDREVNTLVARINKDAGVQLPPEEVQKIVKMKLDSIKEKSYHK